MKRLPFVFTAILVTAFSCVVLARATAPYNSTLSGFQSASSESEGTKIVLDASGDLPGMHKLILRRDGNNVTGGSWTLTVLPANANADSSERGKLTGAVTGGTLSFAESGALTSAVAVRLTVESGTGEYANATGGGTIDLSSAAENPSQLTGTLVLNF